MDSENAIIINIIVLDFSCMLFSDTTHSKDVYLSLRFRYYFELFHHYYLEHGLFGDVSTKDDVHDFRKRVFQRAMWENPHYPKNYNKYDRLVFEGEMVRWDILVKQFQNKEPIRICSQQQQQDTFCLRSYLFLYARWEFHEQKKYFHPCGYPQYSASFLYSFLKPFFDEGPWRFNFDNFVLVNIRLPVYKFEKEYFLARFIAQRLECIVLDPSYLYCRRRLLREFEELCNKNNNSV